MKIGIIGGGAAGFFFGANAAQLYPSHNFTIYEQGKNVLQKVRISGGGRCNVTNAIEEPTELIKHYPRGEKELLGPFYGFNCEHTTQWFEMRGVNIKTESDGRKFPVSDHSQTIINCLEQECKMNGVQIKTSSKVKEIQPLNNGTDGFLLTIGNDKLQVDKLFIGAGSSKAMWEILKSLGHQVVPPVPSLFTFKINDNRIRELPGVAIENTTIKIPDTDYATSGPLLITHKGLSGPAVLKLSAFAARHFHSNNYHCPVEVNFIPNLTINRLKQIRNQEGKSLVSDYKLFPLPKRLFLSLMNDAAVDEQLKWASTSNHDIEVIYNSFCKAKFQINGQNRFKEEFVTAGGIELKEIDFTNFSSKLIKNLFFAGEVLNIDAVTGGFNFQAAWTGAYLAAVGLFDEKVS